MGKGNDDFFFSLYIALLLIVYSLMFLFLQITKMLPGRTDNAVKNRFHATERAKSRGKCDESLYNIPLNDPFFENLKRQHTDIDFDALCEQHANSLMQNGGGGDGNSIDNTRTSSITGSGKTFSHLTVLVAAYEWLYVTFFALFSNHVD